MNKNEILELLEQDKYSEAISSLIRLTLIDEIGADTLAIDLSRKEAQMIEYMNVVDCVLQSLDSNDKTKVINYLKTKDENLIIEIVEHMIYEKYSFEDELESLVFDFIEEL